MRARNRQIKSVLLKVGKRLSDIKSVVVVMFRVGLICIAVAALFVMEVARAQFVHTCLDQLSISGRHCCSPSAYVKISFNLNLYSAGGCDSPSYLDQGVRLEVRRPGNVWEPIRFYTTSTDSTAFSLVTLLPSGTHVQDENNLQFPIYLYNGSETNTISEYLCGEEYFSPGTEYRWLQRYNGPAVQGMEVWSVGNATIMYTERGIHCSMLLTEHAFTNPDGSVLLTTAPECGQETTLRDTVYLFSVSEINGYAQRTVVVTPEWSNAECSSRTTEGCEVSDSCKSSDVGDHFCSVGNVLQCKCQYPQLTGSNNSCIDAILGFEREVYDVSEQDNTARLCVVVLNGMLVNNTSLKVTTHNGTADENVDFIKLVTTITLSPTNPESCVSVTITDDSMFENFESMSVSLSMMTEQLSYNPVELSRDTATLFIADNDFVVIDVVSNMVHEDETAIINLSKSPNADDIGSSVRIDTFNGTAQGGVDFEKRALSLSITSPTPFSYIPIISDSVWEGIESFTYNVVASSKSYNRTIFILDKNELRFGFNMSEYTVNEANGSVEVCVTLQEGVISDTAVLPFRINTQQVESAKDVLDYRGMSASSTLSFNVSKQCFTIVIIDDTAAELEEHLTLFISLPHKLHNVFITQQTATVQIVDNDVVEIGFVQSLYTASEGDIPVEVCVEIKQGSLGVPVIISILSTDSTYETTPMILIPSNPETCVSIVIIDDTILELNETLTLYISVTEQMSIVVHLSQYSSTSTILITDNDIAQIGFVKSSYTASEDDVSIMVCVEVKDGSLGMPIILSLSMNDSSSLDEEDYNLLPISITLNLTDPVSCVSISIIDDLIFEETETLTVSLTMIGQPISSLALFPDTATLFILNNDYVEFGFNQSSYTASEGEMSVIVCVEVVKGLLGIPVNLTLSAQSVTAQAIKDYTVSESHFILRPSDQSSCVVAINIVDDLALEVTESLTVSLSLTEDLDGVLISQPTATILIIDDDDVVVGLNQSSYTVMENAGSFPVCIVLLGVLDIDLEVQLHSSAGTANENEDYASLSDIITFSHNVTEQCVLIEIINDTKVEVVETLTVFLSLVGSLASVNISQQEATIFITDDDTLSVGFGGNYTTQESINSVEVCVMVLTGYLGSVVTLQLSTISGTAEDGVDYTGFQGTTVTLTPSNIKSCVSVTIFDDSLFEETETLTVSLSMTGQVNSAINLSHDTTTFFITDNDNVEFGFNQSSYTASEGEMSVIVCVEVVKGLLGIPVNLTLSAQSVTAQAIKDYTVSESHFILRPSDQSSCVVAINIVDDLALEVTESLTVSLSLTEDLDRVLIPQPTATILIIDDDGKDSTQGLPYTFLTNPVPIIKQHTFPTSQIVDVKVQLDQSSYTVMEDVGSFPVCVILIGTLDTDMELQLQTSEETAKLGEDYGTLSQRVKLSANDSQKCVSIEIMDDTAVELNESLRVYLSVITPMDNVEVFQGNATIFITDDDTLHVGFASNYTAYEAGGSIEVCATVLTGELGTNIPLQLVTIDETAKDGVDYTGLPNTTVTLTPNDPACVSVPIINDSVFEETESLTVSLSMIGILSSAVHFPSDVTTLFINDDDEMTILLEKSAYTTNETVASVDLCVIVVMGHLGTTLSLQLDTYSGTAKAGVDFDESPTVVTLSSNEMQGCASLAIMDDDVVEFEEMFTVSLSLFKESRVHISNESVIVNIKDDDVAVITTTTRAVEQTKGMRVIYVCVVTTSVLERTFIFSLYTRTDNATGNVEHSLKLGPDSNEACVNFTISMEEALTFSVISNETENIRIPNPNGTVIGEPSFDDIKDLISGNNVNIEDVVTKLEGLVNDLINSGQTASLEFTNTFIGVVSTVLVISNNQSSNMDAEHDKSESTESDNHPGTSLLGTLDKFALRSVNSSLDVIEVNNTRLNVLEVGDAENEMSDDETDINGITGPNNETIYISAEILQEFNSSVTVASYYLPNVTGLLPSSLPNVSGSELVSPVLSSALGCGNYPCSRVNSTNAVRILLKHRNINELYEEAKCVFYDLERNIWREEGCHVNTNKSTINVTVCDCNHLTHFAVMLSPKNSVDEKNAFRLQIIGYVGISISLLCLMLTVFIFCFFKTLWSMRNYIHVNLCINLFIAQLLFITGVNKNEHERICQSIAVVLHYSFMVTFMWMLMEGVVLYVALVKVFVTKPHRYIIGFTVVSYGAPFLYMAIVVPLGFLLPGQPHYGGDICWLKSDTNFIWAFAGPVILIILTNIGFFTMAIYIIWKQQKRKNLTSSQVHKAKHWLKVSISLLVVMGISWIIGVLTFHEALLFVSYIFTIVVAFQGATIFILFVVLSKQVRLTLKKWLVKNVINKSEFLSDRFSEFTRSTHAGFSQSHSHSTSHLEKNTVTDGIRLGTFMAHPVTPDLASELKEYEATVSPSPDPTMSQTPSPTPSTPYASSCSSPAPQIKSEENTNEDCGEASPNTFTVIFVKSDKDSGRGSPDTDTICTPPPDSIQPPTS